MKAPPAPIITPNLTFNDGRHIWVCILLPYLGKNALKLMPVPEAKTEQPEDEKPTPRLVSNPSTMVSNKIFILIPIPPLPINWHIFCQNAKSTRPDYIKMIWSRGLL